MAAVALGFSSCKQEDEPKYQDPTTFTINEPALKNQAFTCGVDMTDKATFNLFCSQPDYGYSAICNYSALVSLDPKAPIDEWIALPNENPTQAVMAIKTYELGVAINKLLGITSQEDFDANGAGNTAHKAYFKAVCEIPGIEGSKIISGNAVSYDQVYIQYAEKKAGWIYILGDISDANGEHPNGFTTPNMTNYDDYKAYWSLYEPADMIGEKIYVGHFMLNTKVFNPDADNPVNNCSQFRFMNELKGWTEDTSFGSHKDDFYVDPITDKYETEYKGDIVHPGRGNWGIWNCEEGATQIPLTIVADLGDLKVYVKKGHLNVTFVGRNPSFE